MAGGVRRYGRLDTRSPRRRPSSDRTPKQRTSGSRRLLRYNPLPHGSFKSGELILTVWQSCALKKRGNPASRHTVNAHIGRVQQIILIDGIEKIFKKDLFRE